MHGARLHKTSQRDAMARDSRRVPTGPRPRHIAPRPKRDLRRIILRRDRDETLVRLETVSRLRRLDRDHIPVLLYQIVFHNLNN